MVAAEHDHVFVGLLHAEDPRQECEHRHPQVEPERPECERQPAIQRPLPPRLQIGALYERGFQGSMPRSGLVHSALFSVFRSSARGTATMVVIMLNIQY